LIKFLRVEKIDIVQTFFQDSTLFAGMAGFIARTRVRVACFRDLGFWLTAKQKLALRYIYKTMSGFICNAEVVRQHFSRTFNINTHKMQVIRNGVDVASLRYIEHTAPCRHIGIVGNMTRPVKRTDLFIKAAGIVNRDHPHITWHILGDGHLRPELEQLAKDCQVYEKVIFAGRINNIPEYLEKLDIGIICSDSEGLSNALIEYMFKGVASVATNVGGNPELIEDQQTGLLVPPDNEQLLANAIMHLIQQNDWRIGLAHNAREKVLQEYSWDNCIEQHGKFYYHQLQKSD
jgi:glycosyltransferase involved in cell wall biosynthesis